MLWDSNVRMRVCSIWRCNTLYTCISTWRLRGISIYRELRRRIAEGDLGEFMLSLNVYVCIRVYTYESSHVHNIAWEYT